MSNKKQQEELLKKHLETSKERQKIAATILLYISNLCTDFQLNPEFKFGTPAEQTLVTALRELLSLPLLIQDDTAIVDNTNKSQKIDSHVQSK